MESVDAAGSATHLRHDAHGNVILIEDSAGNRITARHDDRGRRLRLTDPDSGTRAFTWNGLGELIAQTDARGHAVHFRYDALGRLTERWVDGAPAARWDYDGARPGVLDAVHGPDGFVRTYSYDDLLRPTRVITQVTGRLRFAHDTAHDTYYGRAKAVMYPDDEIVALGYDAHGYPVGEHNPLLPGEVYRRIVARTPRGQIAREHFGNGLVAYADRVPSTGAIARLFVLPARAWDRVDADVRARADAPVDAAMVQDLETTRFAYAPDGARYKQERAGKTTRAYGRASHPDRPGHRPRRAPPRGHRQRRVGIHPLAARACGAVYFIEVFVAKELLDGWSSNEGMCLSAYDKCERLIQYAINDA